MLETMIAWNPDSEDIRVGPWPDKTGWSDNYDSTDGAFETFWHEADEKRSVGGNGTAMPRARK